MRKTWQNIVYYRSTGAYSDWATHYFVMTAQADSMLQAGALVDGNCKEGLCARSNLDYTKLERYVRRAVAEFVPQLEKTELVPNQLQLFDFSERKQSNRAVALLPSSKLAGRQSAATRSASDTQVMITRVGDALGEVGALEQLAARREGLFNVTKKISGYNRLTELKPHADKQNRLAYHHDPRSRYVNLPPDLPAIPS